MALTPEHEALLNTHAATPRALEAVTFGLCWPVESKVVGNDLTVLRLDIPVQAGEDLETAAERLDLPWSPRWLVEAGYTATDSAGSPMPLGATATIGGQISWDPRPRLCKVDDKAPLPTSIGPFRRRLASEVAVMALWSHASVSNGIDFGIRPLDLDRNVRGARFRDIVVLGLRKNLPDDWRVEYELPLTKIRGLHMRKDVGDRSSDVVVIDEGNRLVAVVSSKWSWRSDRGTEAAQIILLMRYRSDIPYAIVTAEFPRSPSVARESLEDRAYHLCPTWVGAWLAVMRLAAGSPRTTWPSLAALEAEGKRMAETVGLPGLSNLFEDLRNSGTVL